MKSKEKKQRKYPSLWGCYIQEGYDKSFTRKYLQGIVNVHHYKGHMLLSVGPEKCKAGDECNCYQAPLPYAWLDGDDLDAVIALLRDAKKVWLKAYNKAKRELAKREKSEAQAKARKRLRR